jgi:hypothetical protein
MKFRKGDVWKQVCIFVFSFLLKHKQCALRLVLSPMGPVLLEKT